MRLSLIYSALAFFLSQVGANIPTEDAFRGTYLGLRDGGVSLFSSLGHYIQGESGERYRGWGKYENWETEKFSRLMNIEQIIDRTDYYRVRTQVIRSGLGRRNYQFVQGTISKYGGSGQTQKFLSESGRTTFTGEKVREFGDNYCRFEKDYYVAIPVIEFENNDQEAAWRKYWKNRKVLIYSPLSGKSVVARVIDKGPHSKLDRLVDASPAIMKALYSPNLRAFGLANKKNEYPTGQNVSIAFATETAPLGPVDVMDREKCRVSASRSYKRTSRK